MVFGAKAVVNTENFVGHDQIWKDHVTNEATAAKQWPVHWGFLISQYKKLCNEDDGVPQGAASVRVKERREKLKLPPIDNVKQLGVGASTRSFPKTSSGEIGWRSTQPQCRLERYGRYTKPVQGVLKSLNWPPESVD
ncbi:uncharacterized protein C20orf85-like [Dendronephthya gigantea]|uniref:uncharacterized protein C20orf85-like n=1 Tax=Dendronephthya gigantea TaxID=151771 RepID=UPI00106C8501|nr:uncharacterized protein C20orf85-like [Dendronephthya gigantea]